GVLVVVVQAGSGVGDVTVPGDAGGGQAHGQVVAELAGDIGPGLGAAIVAGGQLDRTALVLERVTGVDLHRPAGGVLAVERALGTAQHFHLADVEQRKKRAVDARVVHVVDVHAHAGVEGLQRVGLADAADEHVHRVRRTATLHDVHVRHRALQAVDVGGLQV